MSDEAAHAALRSEARLVVIEAPAGCGKTHQGAEYANDVAAAGGSGRPLILTHTHAACSVFAERTRGRGTRVDIRTIDSLIGQIAAAYHTSLGLPADIASWVRARGDGHSQLASKVAALMGRHAMIAGAVARRHPVVICDEHQDTSADQHRVVTAVHEKGAALRVFADPMQRIFGDRAAAAETGCDWETLKGAADSVAALDTPHRWSRGCRDLGRWTLEARRSLRDGEQWIYATSTVASVRSSSRNRAQRNLRSGARPRRSRRLRAAYSCSCLRHNETAVSLRSTNRRVPLWEGYTRYALDVCVCHATANGDGSPWRGRRRVHGRVGIGSRHPPSATCSARSKAARPRRGKPSFRNSRGCCSVRPPRRHRSAQNA